MRHCRIIGIAGCILCWSLFTSFEVQAQASWRVVKKYLKPDVEVVEESEDRLVVHHPGSGHRLVFSLRAAADADVCGEIFRRRGSNPHRVWIATAQFWQDPERPRDTWGRYFRAPFLRLIRPPAEHRGS